MWMWLVGCAPDLTPAWAYDPIWLEPSGDGVHGFQSWEVFGPKWPASYNDRHYVCAVVVELDGVPTECDAEPACAVAWEVTPTLAQSDCGEAGLGDDPLFASLGKLALGGAATGEEIGWPGKTSVGWADYGNGWEIHGEAYPEVLDLGGAADSGEWDGVEPFLFVPQSAFPVTP
ncbi:MAG: hypothetical protein ABMA64_31470 [Myxococcota bacterium]